MHWSTQRADIRQCVTVPSFDTCGFEPTYRVEVEPTFPGDGDWQSPVAGFDRDGHLMEPFDSRWGTPLVLRIEPDGGESWVAIFAAGGLGPPLRGAFATPAPELLAVVVDGLAYLVNTRRSGEPAQIIHDQVHQVVPCAEPPLLLVVRFIDMVALGPSGVEWATSRLCVDDLNVIHADAHGITCSCDNLRPQSTIKLDPHTGEQIAGTRMSSFWPPDALG